MLRHHAKRQVFSCRIDDGRQTFGNWLQTLLHFRGQLTADKALSAAAQNTFCPEQWVDEFCKAERFRDAAFAGHAYRRDGLFSTITAAASNTAAAQ
ncbi:MAG: hypothetical protein WD671_11485 [Parvibaculum sp.]